MHAEAAVEGGGAARRVGGDRLPYGRGYDMRGSDNARTVCPQSRHGNRIRPLLKGRMTP